MKKLLACLFAGVFVASVIVLNFGKTALVGNATGDLLLEYIESAAYTTGWVENPGPGDSNRKHMPVECNDGKSNGWKVVNGCCSGYKSCNYNPCPGKDIRGC